MFTGTIQETNPIILDMPTKLDSLGNPIVLHETSS